MNRRSQHASRSPPTTRSRGQLWFGLLGGALAWLTHLTLAYGIAEFGCESALRTQMFWGVSVVAWLLLAATVLTLLAAAAAVVMAYRAAGRQRADETEAGAPGPWRDAARLGLYASVLFVFAILFESIPIFYYLRNC